MTARTTLASVTCFVVGGVYFLPLLWSISLSLRKSSEVYGVVVQHTFQPSNYSAAWTDLGMARLFGNTIIITALTVAIVLVLSVTAAYGVVRYRTRFAEFVFMLILLGLMVPPAAVILPFFVVLRDLGLYNHLFAVVLAEASFALPFGILLMRGYFEQLPRDLTDAARVDGATEWRAFRYVNLPLVRPALVTLGTIVVLATWNGFIFPLLLLADPRSGTLTTAISTFSTVSVTGGISTQIVAAAAVMAAAPVIAILIIARRAYVSGIVNGALKQ
ncbi:MAG: raffinose/stachyose/melibiose transport system permease protein [Gaiellaceae bacterium]|jgi:ABC-type glycerol-3-phosphate transport system permease component|nr:raffinose/stachyose/melibiose transport system permease protein [Gaiellaceae bacterium]